MMFKRWIVAAVAAIVVLGTGSICAQEAAEDLAPPTEAEVLKFFESKTVRLPTAAEREASSVLWPNAPWDKNAVSYYVKAFEALDRASEPFERVTGNLTKVPGSISSAVRYAGDRTLLAEWVEANGPALQWLLIAIRQNTCQLPWVYAKSETPDGGEAPMMPMRFLAYSRSLARTALDAGFLAEINSEFEEAAKWNLATIAMGIQACRNGTLMQFLVGNSEMIIGARPLHRLVSRAETPDAVLWRALAAARQAERDVGVLLAVNERNAELLKFQLAQAPAAQMKEFLGVATHEDALKILARFDAAFAAQMVRPIHELIGKESPFAKALSAEAAGRPGLVERIPLLQRLAEEYARSLLVLRALQTRAAIALYARGHAGEPPERLGDLVPDYLLRVPQDIYVAAPLHYARTDYGWKLWSVGPDKKDDGGLGRVMARQWAPDIIFYSFIETNEEKRSGLFYEFDENGTLGLYRAPQPPDAGQGPDGVPQVMRFSDFERVK